MVQAIPGGFSQAASIMARHKFHKSLQSERDTHRVEMTPVDLFFDLKVGVPAIQATGRLR